MSGLAIRPPKYLAGKSPLSLCNFPRCVTAVALSVRLRIDHPKSIAFWSLGIHGLGSEVTEPRLSVTSGQESPACFTRNGEIGIGGQVSRSHAPNRAAASRQVIERAAFAFLAGCCFCWAIGNIDLRGLRCGTETYCTHRGREDIDSAPFALLGYEPHAHGDSKSFPLQVGHENAKKKNFLKGSKW